LTYFAHIYRVPPYFTNIKRALKKMPKVFLWDWSAIEEEGARFFPNTNL
jgi:hypothetical protein